MFGATSTLALRIILQQQESVRPNPVESLLSSWGVACKKSFEQIRGGVLVDIPFEQGPGVTFKPNLFDQFLVAMHRTAEFTKTRLLVYRDQNFEPMAGFRAQFELVRQLADADPELIRRAATEGVLLSEFPVSVQSAFLDFSSDPTTKAAFADGMPLAIRLYEQPTAQWTKPSDGSKQTTAVSVLSTGVSSEREKAAKLFASASRKTTQITQSFLNGVDPVVGPDFDFGEGEVTTLGVINGKLRGFPNCAIRYDYRFKDQPIFIKGSFKAKDLGLCLQKVATAVVPAEAPDLRTGFTKARAKLMEVAGRFTDPSSLYGTSTLDKSEYQNGSALTVGELYRKSPYFQRITKGMGLDPKQDVKLGATLGLAIISPKLYNGQPVGGTFLISP